MTAPRITDEAVEAAALAIFNDEWRPGDWMWDQYGHDSRYHHRARAALEAAVPLLAPQSPKTVAEAVAYLRARGEDDAVGTSDTRWAYKRSADFIESALTPQPVVDREALVELLRDHAVGRHVPKDAFEYRGNITDAILALLNGGAS